MSKNKQSPAVYPANVYDGDTQNRQQIGTILQSMGFETDDIEAAFNIFEKSYGDKKYDISVLTEIVFQVQSDPNNKLIELEPAQSHSAPNSPQIKPHSANIHQKHNPYYQHPPSQPQQQSQQQSYPVLSHKPRYNNEHAQSLPHNQQPSTNDISSIFNSLSSDHNQSRIKQGKALSASPQLKPNNYNNNQHQHRNHNQILNKPKYVIPDESKMNLISCLESFDKYASDENEIIDVLLQTISNNDDFNNLVNWNDLYQNIKQRKNEWNQFQSQFDASIILQNYDENKHKQIKQNLSNHKSKRKKMKKNNKNETPQTPQRKGDSDNDDQYEEKKQSHSDYNQNGTKLQKALQYELDAKTYDLLTKKDKLLVTANTYSILKNNKEKTELMISKCNEKMEDINRKILELQNEKKQYFSALMRTKNKLSFQIQSIRETEISIKELHEETNKIQIEIESIEKTKNCVNKFESQLSQIDNVLKSNFKTYLEPTWSQWNNREVSIWINHIENEKYKTNINFLSSIQESNLCGKDLPHMNDFILRSFKMDMKSDRDMLLKNIKRVIQLKPKPLQHKRGNNNDNNALRKNSDSTKKQLCVICSDGEANHIMIPCGHIAVCSNCVNQVKQYKKCAFCGNDITNVIKCFHVGI